MPLNPNKLGPEHIGLEVNMTITERERSQIVGKLNSINQHRTLAIITECREIPLEGSYDKFTGFPGANEPKVRAVDISTINSLELRGPSRRIQELMGDSEVKPS